MSDEELIYCYNKGCGKKFKPLENHPEACLYHPGKPNFHDAYKIWQCCKKKSTDFGTWLGLAGCTKGPHNGEKPPVEEPPEKVGHSPNKQPNEEGEPKKEDGTIVWNGLNKPAPRVDNGGVGMQQLKIEISDETLQALERQKQLIASQQQNAALSGGEGAACMNNTCSATYSGPGSADSCFFHPGTAVFHEGMKYWSCCAKKTPDFSSFLNQLGCTKGAHVWGKREKATNVREDWFARGGYIHINFYCKGALPNESRFESDGLTLSAFIRHGFGDRETNFRIELWGRIVAEQSSVIIGERKVEVVLKQATPEGWPKLRYESSDAGTAIDTK